MKCGLGIRPELFQPVLEQKPDLSFLEAHSENYFGESLSRVRLLELAEYYPISLHGVGLSLGRADNLDQSHLSQLKQLVDELSPMLVSEHLAWSAYSHTHIPDLLPLPLTSDSLALMIAHVDQMQQALGRQILVENPSNYLAFDAVQIPEPEFLNQLALQTGCGLLLDVNNIYVSARNLQRDALCYIKAVESAYIAQYHLAGYTQVERKFNDKSEQILIDTHNQAVHPPVWELFKATVAHHGRRPTIVEWDSDFPELSVLLEECQRANLCLIESAPTISVSTVAAKVPSENQVDGLAGDVREFDIGQFQHQFHQDILNKQRLHALAKGEYQHRISVYQNNYSGAMQDYLKGVFVATQGVLGEGYFKQMVRELIRKTPPHKGNLHDYGHQFISELANYDELSNLPYLQDLLQLEWTIHKTYYANTKLLDHAAYSQQQLLTEPLELAPQAQLIESRFPIYQIWRQSLPGYQGEVSIDLSQSQDRVLVYKQHHSVEVCVLEPVQYALLAALKKSQNLLQAIEALAGSIQPQQLSAGLSFIFEKQILAESGVIEPVN